MAITKGFPPSNTISPSVRIAEKDLSFVAPEQTFHRAGLVGFASKGPINVPTLITTSRQLHAVFGWPHPETGDPYLLYAAEQYLLVASELFVVRVADESGVSDERATVAEVDVPVSGEKVVIQSDTPGPYTFSTDSFFRWRVNGVLSSKTLVVLADTYTTDELVDALNDQLDLVTNLDGIQFVSNSSRIAVESTFAYGPLASIELVSVQDAVYGGTGSITGLGTGMTVATVTGDTDRYPDDAYGVAGVWDFTALTDLTLHIVVDGSDHVLVDNVEQVIDMSALCGQSNTTAGVVNHINGKITGGIVPGGFVAAASGNNLKISTLHTGRDAKLLVKTTSAGVIFGFDGSTVKGTSPSGVTGDAAVETYGIVVGQSDSASICFTATADSAGVDGNTTQVKVTNDIHDGVFTIEVYNNGVPVEAWGNLTKNQNSTLYVETFLALVSEYVRVTDNTANGASPLDGTYTLAGGSDGIPSDPDDQDTALIGNPVSYTGLYALSEPEQIDVDMLAVPGHPSTSVVTAMLDVCQNYRQDCLAVIDPPFGLTVSEIIQWQNGTHPLNTSRFDSDFGALYWPWVKIRDTFNKVDVWVPPSGSVMAVIARSDGLAAPWYAPAGLNRGVVPGITDVFSRPTLAERDLMYGNRNCVNPIIQFADVDGFVVMGQKTLQRKPTALDRVNVRRLMFLIEKRIRVAARGLLFDPHDEAFRQRFINLAKKILQEIQVGRGVSNFIIKADTELNTPDVIDRNEFRARIGIIPVHAAEFIFIEFSLHPQGTFAENADTF